MEFSFFFSLSVFLRQAKCHIEAWFTYSWNDLYSEALFNVFWTVFQTNKYLAQETMQVKMKNESLP